MDRLACFNPFARCCPSDKEAEPLVKSVPMVIRTVKMFSDASLRDKDFEVPENDQTVSALKESILNIWVQENPHIHKKDMLVKLFYENPNKRYDWLECSNDDTSAIPVQALKATVEKKPANNLPNVSE